MKTTKSIALKLLVGVVTAMKKHKNLLITLVILLSACLTVQADNGFAISQTKATINVGDTLELSTTETDKTPSWTSYNDNIVKVSTYGEIIGLKKGKTTVRARIGDACRTCAVTVVDSGIKLNKQSAVIYHGGTSANTVQLKATVKGASKDITWKSSDTDIAVVDDTGKVTSVSEGSAVITAAANSKSASCVITVKESSLSLNMDNIQLSTRGVGSSIKITPVITGSGKNVKWTTSDKTIAAVSGGKVTGKKTGTATITAEANGVSAVCRVSVVEGLISINEEKVTLYVGGAKQEAKQLKTNAAKTDFVDWTSSNPRVVVVDAKGLVMPISAGTAIISAECNGRTDTCEVTVKQTSIKIKENSVFLKTKGTDKKYTLNKEIVGRSTKVKWTTSDKKVATVSNGKLTARKTGTVTVTATANGVSDSVVVYVVDYDPSITLNYGQYTLFTVKGNTVNLKAAVDGSSKAVEWQSSDPLVATVTNKGKVSAVNEGTAVITAKANGVTAECLITVKESRVIFNRDSIALDKGETLTIGYDVVGTKQSVKWSTTDSRVVAVKNGILTAKEYGEADIKATANGVTAICHVNVVSCKHQCRSVVTKQPTCAETGTMTYFCVLCGSIFTEEIPATDEHSCKWVTVTEPTCAEKGRKVNECTICGHIEEEQETEAIGHDFSEWETVVPPTSETAGSKKRTCARCGEAEELEIPPVVDEHEHEYIAAVTGPTCNDQGYTTYTCICGESYTDGIVEALGHYYGEWVVVKEATEREAGMEERSCLRCGVKETNTIPVKDHEHNSIVYEVVSPTCQQEGYTVYICTECGYLYDDDHTEPDPEAHNLVKTGGWEPTCTMYGKLYIDCINIGCRYYLEETTLALGHDYQIIEDSKELTGYYGNETSYDCYIKSCSRCDDRYEEYTIAPYCENTRWDKDWTMWGAIVIDPEGYEGQIKFDSFMREELLPYVTFELQEDCKGTVSLSEDGYIKISEDAWSKVGAFSVIVSFKNNPYNASTNNHNYAYIPFNILSPEDIEKQEKIRQVIDEEIKDGMNDAEKILAIHNWICLNCYYDHDSVNGINLDGKSWSAYGAIVKGKAVCEGYAKAFKEFMKELGIECNFVKSLWLNHAWNQVKIEDEWYWLDCTWDDDGDNFSLSYFLRNGKRTEDEKGGTDCLGTKWQFGLPILRKYYASTDSEMNDVYLMQKDNTTLYFMFKSDSEYYDLWWYNIRSDFVDKYQEALTEATEVFIVDGEYIIHVQNSDNLKAYFEERIAMGDTNVEDSDDSTGLTEGVDYSIDEPDDTGENGDIDNPDDAGESDDIGNSDDAGESGSIDKPDETGKSGKIDSPDKTVENRDIDNSDVLENNSDVIESYIN